MVRFICSTEMGATSRDPSQVEDGEVLAAAALQRAQARRRVVELVKRGSWPMEWGISYVPLQLVAERASGSRDDVISALRGELKGLIHTVQARGATARVTHEEYLHTRVRPYEYGELATAQRTGSTSDVVLIYSRVYYIA